MPSWTKGHHGTQKVHGTRLLPLREVLHACDIILTCLLHCNTVYRGNESPPHGARRHIYSGRG